MCASAISAIRSWSRTHLYLHMCVCSGPLVSSNSSVTASYTFILRSSAHKYACTMIHVGRGLGWWVVALPTRSWERRRARATGGGGTLYTWCARWAMLGMRDRVSCCRSSVRTSAGMSRTPFALSAHAHAPSAADRRRTSAHHKRLTARRAHWKRMYGGRGYHHRREISRPTFRMDCTESSNLRNVMWNKKV